MTTYAPFREAGAWTKAMCDPEVQPKPGPIYIGNGFSLATVECEGA